MYEACSLVLVLILAVGIRCQFEGYIVKGQPAHISNFPFSVYLYITCSKGSWNCGASIVNQDIILTAAHCIYLSKTVPMGKIEISAGDAHKDKGQKTTANHYILHDEYDEVSSANDIALIKLKTRFLFDANTSRVALMLKPPQVNEAVIAGWGVIDDVQSIPPMNLRYTKQTLWTREKCEKVYGRLPHHIFCAQSKITDQYVARGDSGSPLVINGYIQIGIVSFKRPKTSKSLIVYTNVSSYLLWIRSTAKRLYCRH